MAIPSDPYRIIPRRRERPVPSTFRPRGVYCSDSEWSSSSSSSSSSGSSSASGSSSSTLKPSPASSWDFDDPASANVIPGLRQRSKMRLGLGDAFMRKDTGVASPTMPSRPAPSPPSLSDAPKPAARGSSKAIAASRRPVTPTRGSSMGDRTAPLSPTPSSSASTHSRSRSFRPDSPRSTTSRSRPSTSSPSSSSSTVSPSQAHSVTPRSTSQAVLAPSVAAANARLTEAMLNELEGQLADKPYSPPSDAEMISLPSCDSIALFALGLPTSSATELSMASAPAVGPSSPRQQLPPSSFSTLSASNGPTTPLRLGGVPDRAELIKPWVEQVSQAAQRSVGVLPMRESGPSSKDEVSLRERRAKAPLTLRLAKSQSSLNGQAIASANSLLRSGLRSPGIYSPPPCPPPTAPLPNLPSMASDSVHATPRPTHTKRRSTNQPSPLRGESSYSQTWRISAASNVSGASSFKTSLESISRNSIDARSGFSSARNSHLSTASFGASAPPARRSRGMTFSGGYRLSSSTELSYYSQRSESPSECASSSSALSQSSPKTPLTPLDTLDLSGMQGQGMAKGGLGLDALTQLANALQLEQGGGAAAAHHHARKESFRFAMPGQFQQDEDVVYGIAM